MAEEKVTDEEDLILKEIGGMWAGFLGAETDVPIFAVCVGQQDPDQDQVIPPDSELREEAH